MVKRLFDELNRQLIRVERASSQLSDKKNAQDEYDDDPERRASDAHTLATLVRSVEKLISIDGGRSAIRATKAARKPKDVRKVLAKQISGKPERSGKTKLSEQPE
jgi:hypothetical protein